MSENTKTKHISLYFDCLIKIICNTIMNLRATFMNSSWKCIMIIDFPSISFFPLHSSQSRHQLMQSRPSPEKLPAKLMVPASKVFFGFSPGVMYSSGICENWVYQIVSKYSDHNGEFLQAGDVLIVAVLCKGKGNTETLKFVRLTW